MIDRLLGARRTRSPLRYATGNLGVQLLSQAFATYATYYYVDRLGVPSGLIGLAMVLHGVANAVLNPLIGHLSDRTRTRWGRRLPYIALGTVPLAAAQTLVWTPLVDGATARFWYFLAVVLVYDLLTVLVVLNYVALFPELFPTTGERARAAPSRQALGIGGMVLGVAAAPLLYGSIGWPAMGAAFGLIATGCFLVSLRGSVERPEQPREAFGFLTAVRYTLANRAFLTYAVGSFLVQLTIALMQAGLPFFTKYVLHEPDSANTLVLGAIFATAVPAVWGWGRLTVRLGPRRAVLAATGVLALGLTPFLLVGTLLGAVLTAALVGLGIAGMLVLLEIMLAEVIDDDETRTAARREGMYMGMNGFIVRWSVSLQAAVLSLVLAAGGYRSGADVQPASALSGIRLLLGAVPPAILLLAAACFALYPLRGGRDQRPAGGDPAGSRGRRAVTRSARMAAYSAPGHTPSSYDRSDMRHPCE